MHLVGAALEPLEEALDTVEGAIPLDDEATLSGGQIFPRAILGYLAPTAKRHQVVLTFGVALGLPRPHRAFTERPSRIGNDEIEVDAYRPAETLARFTGTERAVEREQIGDGLRVGDIALGAMTFVAESLLRERARGGLDPDAHATLAVSERLVSFHQ